MIPFVSKPLQVLWFAIAIWLCSISASYSASVAVTADFTKFTMGGFYNADHTFTNQLLVNGTSIDICGGDTSCANALSNPSSISANLSGSSVDFGYDRAFRQNAFSFTGNSTDVTGTGPQNQFTLGKFTFTNGGFYPLAFLDFTLTTHSVDPLYNNHTFTGQIRLDTNSLGVPFPTDLEKIAEADYFTLQDPSGTTYSSLGSVRVYDYNNCLSGDLSTPNCNTGSVDLIGHINSLHLDSFGNPTGGAFLNSSTTATLDPPANSVPEPNTLWLIGSGLAVFFASRRLQARIGCAKERGASFALLYLAGAEFAPAGIPRRVQG